MQVRSIRIWAMIAVLAGLLVVPLVSLGLAADGADVLVIDDNNNVDGGEPDPSFDTQNRQQNETTVAISPVAPNIVASGANDYRMVSAFGDSWLGFYVSGNAGATWFNTMVPGFPTDLSAAGQASPLLGLDGSGDPVVRFDAQGNLYVAGIAFNRDFDQPERPVDNVVYVARYDYTPGSPAGESTPSSAANPPNFTYAGTTVVERGAVGFAVPPNQPYGFAGEFVDKEWMEVDTNSPEDSLCAGSVYVTYTAFHGVAGNSPIKFSRSSDGGAAFSHRATISTGGKAGTSYNQGSDIAVGPDGTVYVAYRTFASNVDPSAVSIVKSADCGRHWTQPVVVGNIVSPQAPGVAFRTPAFAFVIVDDLDPDIVYVAYQSFNGDYDILVQRSIDGGGTWEAPIQVNEDPAARHQIFPTIQVSNGALHVAWYDFRHSTTPGNEALDVYYACTNCDGSTYPNFSSNVRVTDVSHQPNCLMFGGGSAAFHGDYIELDARFDGAQHIVHVAWTDNRDVSECDLDPAPGPDANNTGNRNQNVYADTLTVGP